VNTDHHNGDKQNNFRKKIFFFSVALTIEHLRRLWEISECKGRKITAEVEKLVKSNKKCHASKIYIFFFVLTKWHSNQSINQTGFLSKKRQSM